MKRATAMIGIEKRSRNATTVPIHTNTGIRNSRMPLARMLKMVTMKLTAETNDASPMS